MTKCLKCGKETKNKKFCSRSCANSRNNIGVRRHGNNPTNCLNCGNKNKSFRSKYCSHNCHRQYERKLAFDNIEKTGEIPMGKYRASTVGHFFLFETRGKKCEECGLSEWNGEDLRIEVHHIDGKSKNNRLTNLKLLCPNCHSQTNNYGYHGKTSDREWRKNIKLSD